MVLYSFPHKIGAGRICYTAWQQAAGAAAAGIELSVNPGVLHRPLPQGVRVSPTLAAGPFRISYKLVGTVRACSWHDRIVAHRLRALHNIFAVHGWSLGSAQTFKAAKRSNIPTFLERPNAHTRFAYDVVRAECARIDVPLPRNHEHAFNPVVLRREEEEYELADYILCPSDFVVKTFLDQGVAHKKLIRHTYGFDPRRFYPAAEHASAPRKGITALFAGVCAVRKGLHFALDAWLSSAAARNGQFLIAGTFLPAYRERLEKQLSHPSVRVLGHRDDVPELMRKSDVLLLPSIEEGFGLVVAEAMASGCVPMISRACTNIVMHGIHGYVHEVGDVHALSQHLSILANDRATLQRLRAACVEEAPNHTWEAAGRTLASIYARYAPSHA